MRAQADILAHDPDKAVAQLGGRIARALPLPGARRDAGSFLELTALTGDVNALVARLKDTTDKAIQSSIALEYRKKETFLTELTAFMETLQDIDEADDQDAEDDEEVRQVRVGMQAAVEALGKALRAKARAVASGRTLGKQTRNGRLNEWLGERGLQSDELKTLGVNLRVQVAARRFLNPVRQLIDGMPRRYRRFRRERQAEGRWYMREGFSATELNPLEVDVILLSILRSGRTMLGDRRIRRAGIEGMFSPLAPIQALLRNQILVDEATDFSPVQLACMTSLCDPASLSFVACGDFNQRITEWGSRSVDDLRWVASDIDVRAVSVTYRHSRQLNELARAIAQISTPDVPEAHLPQRVNNDGVDPVLETDLKGPEAVAEWLRARITEIERLTKAVPPIAVLVASEDDVQPMTRALNDALASGHLLAVACNGGQLAGQNNDVRVFDVQHIKGLEFEAVFFVGIDKLAERYAELFEKFLYVGATRAAMYLGMTTGGSVLPAKMTGLASRFKASWP
ncbi:ATP-binding domain-containing protein [Roseiarcaceae bacterium H3SJ34-1]|uniref:ATP-binding domain-containing protein n=1 Tax=Terripilifer ovatus TaxID=3032367 RepID=UPI003AB9834B|nr:ATP-binding domain-containing protein [Roseiarcaceae bacterium H3SJ34-1]